MPGPAYATIALGGLLAVALVLAVTVILVQLRRTSRVLGDIDALIDAVPPCLTGLAPMLARIKRATG